MRIPPKQKSKVWAKTHGHCWYCGDSINPFDDFCIEHVDPRHRGGNDDLTNLLPSCKTCNARKRNKNLEEFRDYLQKSAIPKLHKEQLAYLENIGVRLPGAWPQPPRHIFWGEQEQAKV